jgi:hypothetical protein
VANERGHTGTTGATIRSAKDEIIAILQSAWKPETMVASSDDACLLCLALPCIALVWTAGASARRTTCNPCSFDSGQAGKRRPS